MTGFQVLRIIQSIPLPRRDDFCIRAMILALDNNKSLPAPDWVAARVAILK